MGRNKGCRDNDPVKSNYLRALALRRCWENEDYRTYHLKALDHNPAFGKGHRLTESQRRGLECNEMKRKDTSIELIVQQFLTDKGIVFEKHKYFRWNDMSHCTDIFVSEYDLVIECDGDYWHRIPKVIEHDKMVNTRLFDQGHNVLRLWEKDIRSGEFVLGLESSMWTVY